MQGPEETEWYEFKNNKSQIVDGNRCHGAFSMLITYRHNVDIKMVCLERD